MGDKRQTERVLNVLADEVWAMTPGKLDEVSGFVALKMAGMEIKDFQAKAVGDKDTGRKLYEARDGVAVIGINDVMVRRANLFTNFSGGTSTDMVVKALGVAAKDATVKAVLFDVSSPGGSVHAPLEIVEAMRTVQQSKPVVAWTGEMMASAAYWVGSAADFVMATESAAVGSIGVAAVHYDVSESDKQRGVRRTMISAGKFKRIASDEKPLSPEGHAYLQEQVDTYYDLFINAVAENRGVNADTVRVRMADGRIFIGEQAKEAGLIDGIGNFEAAMDVARSLANKKEGRMGDSTKQAASPESGGLDMKAITPEQLRAERPDLVETFSGEGKEKALAEGKAQGVAEERARVVEILEAKSGREITLKAVQDGTEPGAFFKLALKDERGRKDAGLKELASSAAPTVGTVEPKEPTAYANPREEVAALVAEAKQGNPSLTDEQARAQVYKDNPELKQRLAAYVAKPGSK